MHEAKFLSLYINKAKRELNWRPKINIKELVREMVEFELNTKKTKN